MRFWIKLYGIENLRIIVKMRVWIKLYGIGNMRIIVKMHVFIKLYGIGNLRIIKMRFKTNNTSDIYRKKNTIDSLV